MPYKNPKDDREYRKAYRAKKIAENPRYYLDSAKAYYEQNKEHLRAVNREKAAARRAKNPEADRQRQRTWLKKNRDRMRETYRQRDSKFPAGLFAKLLIAQNNLCAICGTLLCEDGGKPNSAHADHDHEAEFPREILCSHCNTGLGFFRDSPELLEKAARYTQKWADIISAFQ